MSSDHEVTLAMSIMLLLSFGVLCSAVPENNTEDMLSLIGFKQAITYDPSGILKHWNRSTTFCRWEGIKCSRRHPGRIVELHLAGLKLSGQISSLVGNLTFLKKLNLSTNGLSGRLPPLNRLHRQQILDLGYNSLQDTIPDALANCSKLRKLFLSYNSFVGEIPPKLGLLSNLSDLRFNTNNLTGTIPSTFSNSSSIQVMSLSYNHLSGGIPDELGKLPSIRWLALGGNRLIGGFPQGLLNLSNSLRVLGLESNKLGNRLPLNIGDSLSNLQWLFLNRNMFQGKIPASLGNVLGMERLELENNNFTGEIPSSLGKLKSLYYLNLGGDGLEAKDAQSWEFFNALINCSGLNILALDRNQLDGTIPGSIGNLSNSLEMLTLGGNKLSGIVPTSVANLQSLINLGFDYNNLSGKIVEWVGMLTKLQSLNLYQNKFSGPIPSSMGNLTQLTLLSLALNEFEDLSDNTLQSNITLEVGALKQIVDLRLSSNKLTGEIPHVLGQCQNLVTIQMDQNLLIGDIPASLGNLKSLNMVNLSHNNLSGTIPEVLADLPLLDMLDLSYNQLQGEVPRTGVFKNAPSVYLDGNFALCGGVVDLGMPLCPATSQRKGKKYYLVRVLIPVFGFLSLIMLIAIITLHKKKKSHRAYISSTSFGGKFPRLSYYDLARATGNFCEANVIGRGSCGSVYRGKLTQLEMEVAIKVFDPKMRCVDKSFISECKVLRSIRHRYITPILTACLSIDNSGNAFKALIYVLMPNRNLDKWLHEKPAGEEPIVLGLGQRISMVVNIADALAYLHHDSRRSIVHRDLKPSNILLDVDMNAHLGDFGIANLVLQSGSATVGQSSSGTSSSNSVGLKGTIGYIAPEYANSGQASTCGDVFSFGIIILEMLIGKRPTDCMFQDGLSIVNFVERNFPDQIERMIMREVAIKLHAIRVSYVGATKVQQDEARTQAPSGDREDLAEGSS
ncbi:receptor kinase-like protein Xa21 [Triticum aestivum]|uniref:receptor kinase-like protein Xa21 n=1 Tax=Triticum aestivum TaxID=4565 RepID=UPI001D02BFF3|nr:receptor kinase-like protein Xa21 [Triticum aestivum]